MNSQVITPPYQTEVISVHQTPDGRTTRVGLFLSDCLGRTFSLQLSTVEAQAEMLAVEDAHPIDSGEREPVFLLAGSKIDPDEIDTILGDMGSELLGQFVVLQDDDS